MSKKSIAIIGGGIAGLSAAWLLRKKYRVVLFEQEDYLGGHAHTIEVQSQSGIVGIDTGFVVYNQRNYPLLTRLFEQLGVQTQPTDMSFSASVDSGAIEYAGSSLNTLFGQRRNLVRPGFWTMVADIVRFNRESKQFLKTTPAKDLTTGDFLDAQGYSDAFRNHYLLPMAAAIWSCPVTTMMEFPASSLLQFFHNHGLLDLSNRPQWRTVVGGSYKYVERIQRALLDDVRIGQPVTCVRRDAASVRVITEGGLEEVFDEVVFATHADTTLRLLKDPTRHEQSLLNCFQYQTNHTLLHTDSALMPTARRVWASWNYLAETRKQQTHAVSVTYWMNNLHKLNCGQHYFVSLNPLRPPSSQTVIAEFSYDHPVFDSAAILAQTQLERIQGVDRIWFTGSYLGYGFHEDALRSSVHVAQQLGVEMPWSAGTSQGASSLTSRNADDVVSVTC